MRTFPADPSAPGPGSSGGRPDAQSGFSLVELLAALAIMSLMMGLVIINLPSGRSDLDQGTESLELRLQAQLDAAARAGEMVGLRVRPDGLAVVADTGAGLEVVADYPWPDGARVRLREGGTVVSLEDDDEDALFWVEPYGAVPDIELDLSGFGGGYALRFDDRGRLVRSAAP